MYFCISVNFKTLENITPIDPDKISRKKHFHVYKQAVGSCIDEFAGPL
jgi:hypothetical protein